MPDPVTKRCTKCGNAKPLSEFCRASNSRDGLARWCKGCRIEYNHKYYKANRAVLREQQRQYRETDPEGHRERCRKWRAKARQQVFAHYGAACACCGATKNLTIDHIAGDGARHRRELFGGQSGGGVRLYAWIVRQGFPPGYQTLCHPCNLSKSNSEHCYLHGPKSGEHLIFNFYRHVRVKLGDEAYDFERSSLMFSEVVAMEDATGLSFGEWQAELGRYSIRAVAGLLHVLRKRAGVPSDFETMNFSADDLDVVPLREDGTEMTAAEVAEDIGRRVREAREGPTGAGEPAAAAEDQPPGTTASTSPSSPSGSESAPGNGTGSPGPTSGLSSALPTPG